MDFILRIKTFVLIHFYAHFFLYFLSPFLCGLVIFNSRPGVDVVTNKLRTSLKNSAKLQNCYLCITTKK